MKIRYLVLSLILTLVMGLSNACRADVTIVHTPSGTNVCTTSGSGSVVICY